MTMTAEHQRRGFPLNAAPLEDLLKSENMATLAGLADDFSELSIETLPNGQQYMHNTYYYVLLPLGSRFMAPIDTDHGLAAFDEATCHPYKLSAH